MGTDFDSKPVKWKLPVAIAAGCVLLAGLGFGGFKAYHKMAPERLARQAQAYLEKGDFKNALLAASRALEINRNSVAATTVVAEYAEKAGNVDAIVWRQRVADLHPGPKESLAWAAAALQFGRPTVAKEALSKVQEADRHTGEYQTSAGATAVSLGNVQEAEKHYAEALKLDPQNELFQYNCASLQLQSAKPEVQKAARETLERLCGSAKYHTFAHRSLTLYFAGANELGEALKHAKALQTDPGAIFGDRISYADLLRRTSSPDLGPYLDKLRADTAAKPGDAAVLLGWMGMNGMVNEAIAWAKTFPPKQLSTVPIGPPLAQCYLATKDWPKLQELLKNSEWGGLEYSRHTLLARALKEMGDKNGFSAQWGAATSAALKRADVVHQLVRLATSWGWDDEVRDLLWRATEDTADPKWALGILYAHYSKSEDTRSLHRVASRLAEIEPANDEAKNNVAMLSMLIDKKNVDRAATISRELHARKPDNASFASTYAYALHLQKHTDEALRVMDAIDAKQLETPSIAAYYAIFLAAKGEKEKAAKYFDLAKTAKLLPEERELVADAQASLK